MSASDPDLVTFAREGCASAFRRLVERHVDSVFSTASRLLRDWPADPADVTQSAFILLARKAPRLSRDIVLSAWLHRQTVRLALNARRADARRTARETTAAQLLAMHADDPPDYGETIQVHIDKAIHTLPESDRQLIALHYFSQWQQKEIASRMGLSPDAVQKRLSRALARVRQRLLQQGVAVPAAALTAWLGSSSVKAAPPELGSMIAVKALAHTATGTGILTKIITIMAHTKALTAGAAFGIATGGFWVAWAPQAAPSSSLAVTHSQTKPNHDRQDATGNKDTKTGTLMQPSNTLEGLVAQLQAFARLPYTEITRLQLQAWMTAIPVEHWDRLMRAAVEQLNEEERTRLLPRLARAWASKAPAAAVAGLAAMQGLTPTCTAESLTGDAFTTWHESDPQAARQWLLEHQDEPVFSKALVGFVSTIATSLAASSDDEALAWALQLQGDDLRLAALTPVLRKSARNGIGEEWMRMLTRLSLHEDEAFASLATSFIIGQWIGTRSLEDNVAGRSHIAEADGWVTTLPAGPRKNMAARALLRASFRSTEKVPPDQAIRVLQQSDPGLAQEAAREIILKTRNISPAAREWMLPLLTGPDREVLIQRAARQFLPGLARDWGLDYGEGRGTHGDAILWAAELTDPEVRDPLVYGLCQQWQQYATEHRLGEDEINQWVKARQLKPEVKSVIEKAQREFISSTP